MRTNLVPGDLVSLREDYSSKEVLLTSETFNPLFPAKVTARFSVHHVGLVITTKGRYNEFSFVVCPTGCGWTFSEYMRVELRNDSI